MTGFPATCRKPRTAATASGNSDSVLVQHLVLDVGSMDARMAQIIVEKMDVITAAVDSKSADASLQAPTLLDVPVQAPQKAPEGPVVISNNDLTRDQIAAVHEALRIVAGNCDGAQALDGAGFNKLDSRFGKDLASRTSLTQGQAKWGRTLAIKYGRQLPADLLRDCERLTLKTRGRIPRPRNPRKDRQMMTAKE